MQLFLTWCLFLLCYKLKERKTMKQITCKNKTKPYLWKKPTSIKLYLSDNSFLFHAVIISCLDFSAVLMVSRGNTDHEMSTVTGTESCCLPWRWARRGWPGELGSGCSCTFDGSSAGTPGRSWSASFWPWAGLAGGAKRDCQPRSAHRGSTATHRWGPWWAVVWEANTWEQGGQKELLFTCLRDSCLLKPALTES